ncbi:MAG: YsnF/AvaK domain-containing protein [Gemmatimonadales bacterium]
MTPRKNQFTTTSSDVDTNSQTVVGLFTDRSGAEAAMRELKQAGFSDDQIGVAMQNRDEQKSLMEDTNTQAAEGAATGAVSGGVVGGLLGLLGSLLIPGVGPIVVGGVLASTLTGVGIGAATGGLIGGLIGLGVPEQDAEHFDKGIRSGGVLVTVNAGQRALEARAILQRNDADFGPSGASRFGEFEAGELSTTTTGAGRGDAGHAVMGSDTGDRLELREEQLEVEKERAQTGEVRLRKEVVTEKKTIEVPVTREEVVIERHAVGDREATSADIGEGKEIRIPLMEEQVNVQKRAVVKEEISLGKRQIQDRERVSETVRHEEARIEAEGDVGVRPLEGGRSARYQGSERRRGSTAYRGPERRLAGV